MTQRSSTMDRLLSPLLLAAALLLGPPAPAARATAEAPLHRVTTADEAARSAYYEGLAHLHRRQWSEAERAFQAATATDPDCALAHWGAARAHLARGEREAAAAVLERAQEVAPFTSHREQLFVEAFEQELTAAGERGNARDRTLQAARRGLERAITLYPDDPELWAYRGDLAENPTRSIPYYLAALRLEADHPGGGSWSLAPPPLPEVTAEPASVELPNMRQAPRLFEGLGSISHRISTESAEAQAYYDQGLRLFYSYIYREAARNFQHAVSLDPENGMLWWGLSIAASRARGSNVNAEQAARRALELSAGAPEKEQRMIRARLLQLDRERREEFFDALDALIAFDPEDTELWMWRGLATGQRNGMPYFLATLRLNDEHHGAHHELIHAYEGSGRPALGWAHAEGYRRTAPNQPHAHHMGVHLAMRLGRWEFALAGTTRSVELQQAGFPEEQQFHHVDIMTRALVAQGKFAEVKAHPDVRQTGLPWARMLLLEKDWDGALGWAESRRRQSPRDAAYIAALVYLNQGDLENARAQVAIVEERTSGQRRYQYWDVQGRYLVLTGQVDEGLKMLEDATGRMINDYGAHAWGGGSQMMEAWGEAALAAGRWEIAEEAFLEGLAHEHGSALAALGLQVVAEKMDRADLAAHYAARADRNWQHADEGALEAQLARLRRLAEDG